MKTRAGDFPARYVVNCAGLYSDRVAQLAGDDPGMMLVPFRGEYYDLAAGAEVAGACADLSGARSAVSVSWECTSRGGFTGTWMRDRTRCWRFGARDIGTDGFRSGRDDGSDRDSGFRAMARKHWKNGMREIRRSLVESGICAIVPAIASRGEDGRYDSGGSGVRAQAVAADGTLVDDFRFVARERFLHVLNVPSPAATASLPIGREILRMVPGGDYGLRSADRSESISLLPHQNLRHGVTRTRKTRAGLFFS